MQETYVNSLLHCFVLTVYEIKNGACLCHYNPYTPTLALPTFTAPTSLDACVIKFTHFILAVTVPRAVTVART